MTLGAIRPIVPLPGSAASPNFGGRPGARQGGADRFVYLPGVGGFVTRGSGMKVTVYISRAVRYRQ